METLRRRGADRWFRERADQPEGAARDPLEPTPGWRGHHRIRKREDGACGFLSLEGRCRLHEELGADRKPLTCRLFPYSFHPAPSAVIVKTSFGCPTVVANRGEPIGGGARLDEIEVLRTEWFAGRRSGSPLRVFVEGRPIDAATLRVLRENLLAVLARVNADGTRDLRQNMLRVAHTLEDLTRSRVVRLTDADFAEYVALTTGFAATTPQAVEPRPETRVGRLLQHGFLFVVAAMRLRIEYGRAPRWRIRLATLRLLAHFHRLAPAFGRVDLGVLRRTRLDLNAPEIQPLAYHYLRASIEGLGAGERPVLDDFAIAVSYLNAARALAVMNSAAGQSEGLPPRLVDRAAFGEALMEAVDLSHTGDRGVLGRILGRFAGGTDAVYAFARRET